MRKPYPGAILRTLSTNVATRARRHPIALCTAVAVVVGALAGCGSTSHRYIANTSERVYAKVPRDWEQLDFDESDPDRLEQITSQATVVWRSAAAPTAGEAGVEAPLVFIAVYELSGELNQQMSASLARVAGSPVGFDPVLPQDDTQRARTEVLSYQPLDFDNMNGTRAVFRTRDDAQSEWRSVYDISTAYDSGSFRLYVLQVGCNVACYESNQAAIDKVASSFLVKP